MSKASGSFATELVKLPSLRGRVFLEEEACAAAGKDFGNIVSQRPLAVLKPRSAEEVAIALRFCRDHRVPVAMKGQAHSTYGQAQTRGGLVIDSSRLSELHSVNQRQIVIGAGALWRNVLEITLPLGLTPPVLTDYLGLSVGGTLSVGGLGGTSARYGSQADNVHEIEVALPNGEIRVCSPSLERDLFDAVLCGLGQCGLITRVALGLIPAPTKVRRFKLAYDELAQLTADQLLLLKESRFDYVEAQIFQYPLGKWAYVLETCSFNLGSNQDDLNLLGGLYCDPGAAEITDLSYAEFLERIEPSVARMQGTGEWQYAHPWLNLLLPASEIDQFVGDAVAGMRSEDIGNSEIILLYPMMKKHFKRPLLRLPDSDTVFLLAILRAVPPDAFEVDRLLASNRNLYDLAISIGGVGYPVGSIPFTRHDWEAHFGATWDMYCDMKNRFDQHHVLTPGHGIFLSRQTPLGATASIALE